MSKKVIEPYHVVVAQSLAASFQSAASSLKFMDRICYSANWTGSAVGTLIAQASVDGVNWADLEMNPIVLNNASDNAILDIQTTGATLIRLSYTRTSGTGSMDAFVAAKES